jgi:hypothetical protein
MYIIIKAYFFFQEKLSEELRDAMKKSRKESELNTVDSQIKGLDMRLKYGKTDKENTVSIQFHLIQFLCYKNCTIINCLA